MEKLVPRYACGELFRHAFQSVVAGLGSTTAANYDAHWGGLIADVVPVVASQKVLRPLNEALLARRHWLRALHIDLNDARTELTSRLQREGLDALTRHGPVRYPIESVLDGLVRDWLRAEGRRAVSHLIGWCNLSINARHRSPADAEAYVLERLDADETGEDYLEPHGDSLPEAVRELLREFFRSQDRPTGADL
jgi:hypothetical protein